MSVTTMTLASRADIYIYIYIYIYIHIYGILVKILGIYFCVSDMAAVL